MGIFSKLAFWKHEPSSVPTPSTESFGAGQGLDASGFGTQTGLGNDTTGIRGDSTGLGDVGTGSSANLGAGNNPSQETGFKPPSVNSAQYMEPVEEETPPSQPSSLNKLNQNIVNPNQPADSVDTLSKNVEIISSKVDTIKAILDNLSHKIEEIEKIAKGEEEQNQKRDNRW